MITAIVDLQFGSTGKGLLAGYLSQKNEYDVVVSANMPNAGHTFVDSAGKKWVNKVLPSGVYSIGLHAIAIGPGAIFDPQQLVKEIEDLKARGINAPILIHPEAAILLPGHKVAEQQGLNHISSTMQGSMEAMFHKMRRHDIGSNTVWTSHGVLSQIAVDYGNQQNLWDCVVDHNMWQSIMHDAKEILVEGSQGYSLGINAGFYPYCTSRDCTVWRLISDCAVPVKDKMKVIGSARVHPIRVGNTPGGTSGGCYPDQRELSWKDVGVEPETTTVTGRERRVFTFSERQIEEALWMNRVDQVFLNFCNYDPRYANDIKKRIDMIGGRLMRGRGAYAPWMVQTAPSPDGTDESPYPLVRYMGFGPAAKDIIEVSTYD